MRPLLGLWLVGSVFGQGTVPRERAENYPVHALARSAALGAQFLDQTVAGARQTSTVKGYVVVEVALYPPPGRTVDVHSGNFILRINGKKQELLPQPPSRVAATATPGQAAVDAALPQGEHRSAVSGLLYFAYSGKLSAIKSLVLRYEDATLQLK